MAGRLALCVLALSLTARATLCAAHAGAPLAPHDLLRAWNDEWWIWLLIALSGWLYLRGVRRLWCEAVPGAGVTRLRAWSFAAGWFALCVALLSPLDPLGNTLFSVHMMQHEILMLVAAPLLVIGRPLGPFIWALRPSWRRPAAAAGRAIGLQAAVRFLSRPFAAWTVHAAVLWSWHAPVLFQAALENEAVHTAQHLSFFLSALLFWWALLERRGGPAHYGAGLIYVFTTGVHSSILGALLTFATTAWYPFYESTAPAWGVTPLEDQQIGGLIMWVPGGMVFLVVALALLAAWLDAAARGSLREANLTVPEAPCAPKDAAGGSRHEGIRTV